jgi:hypothetical protein
VRMVAISAWTCTCNYTKVVNYFSLYSRPAVALIRKLIAVLESIERLPLHLYDTPGSTYNLQVTMKNVASIDEGSREQWYTFL